MSHIYQFNLLVMLNAIANRPPTTISYNMFFMPVNNTSPHSIGCLVVLASMCTQSFFICVTHLLTSKLYLTSQSQLPSHSLN